MGAVITHLFQRSASRRSEQFARSEALRQERLATCSAFASAAEEYRRGQADRWYRKKADPDGEAFRAARDEAHRLRTAARQVLYRLQLVTDDRETILAAVRAYDCIRDVSTAREQAEHDVLDRRAKEAIEVFVADASPMTG